MVTYCVHVIDWKSSYTQRGRSDTIIFVNMWLVAFAYHVVVNKLGAKTQCLLFAWQECVSALWYIQILFYVIVNRLYLIIQCLEIPSFDRQLILNI